MWNYKVVKANLSALIAVVGITKFEKKRANWKAGLSIRFTFFQLGIRYQNFQLQCPYFCCAHPASSCTSYRFRRHPLYQPWLFHCIAPVHLVRANLSQTTVTPRYRQLDSTGLVESSRSNEVPEHTIRKGNKKKIYPTRL